MGTLWEDKIPRVRDTSSVANAIEVTVGGPWYYDGQMVVVRIANANTGATTLSIDGKTATACKKLNDQALTAGDLEAGQWAIFVYNATDSVFEMLSQTAVAAPTGATGATGATGDTGATGPTGP